MAKSKTQKNKSKTRPVDDDEPQVKSRSKTKADDDIDMEIEDVEEEATELDADEAAEVEEDAEEVATELDADAEEEATELDMEDEDAGDTELDTADEDDEEVEADDDDDEEDDEDEEESVDEGPVAPPAKITKMAIALILLNWLAAPTFLWLAYTDHVVRVQFAYRTNLNYIQIWGLPLKSEDDPSFASETRPLLVLTSQQLEEAFRSRPGANKPAAATNKFAPFEESVSNRIPIQIRPKDLTPDLLKDVFQGLDSPVKSLEDEIERVKGAIDTDITTALGDVNQAFKAMKEEDKRKLLAKSNYSFSYDPLQAKKLETQLDETKGADLDALVKRHMIRMMLFTMAPMPAFTGERLPEQKKDANHWQILQLEEKLQAAKGSDLDKLFDDAVQRRMYYDILAPIEIYRPGPSRDAKAFKVENLADLDRFKLDAVKKILSDRLDAAVADEYNSEFHAGKHWTDAVGSNPEANKRDSLERRQKIAFIMFTLSQASVPIIDRKLYPKGVERAQVVCGLYEFTNASIFYVQAQRVLEDRIIEAIVADRDGHLLEIKDKVGEYTRTPGFPKEYEALITDLVGLVKQIDDAQRSKADLIKQRDHYEMIYKQRVQQREDTLKKLLTERRNTERYLQDLRLRQDELHAALVELSEAGDRNIRLEAEIRTIETRLLEEAARLDAAAKKGKKKQ